jgi:tRNA uridine 5-carboxymethylaminomethyl modification enzyme
MEALGAARERAAGLRVTPDEAAARGFGVNRDGVRRSLLDLMTYPEVSLPALRAAFPEIADVPAPILQQLAHDARYAPYIERQRADVEGLRRDESEALPEDLDYAALPGLSNELKAKLVHIRPRSLGQAGRIEGMTPAALTLILMKIRQRASRATGT